MLVLNIINGKCVKIKVTKITIVKIELSAVYISIENLVSSIYLGKNLVHQIIVRSSLYRSWSEGIESTECCMLESMTVL